jgi:histidinol-phosphate aminotransferase
MAPTFVRQTVRAMDGYTPGEQPGVSERVVKLNTNENPFPPSQRVLQAIRDIEGESLRRYPSPTADQFRFAAAKLHSITPDMIIAGNGSDDILTIATRTFLPPGGLVAFPDPTYSLYRVLGELQDARSAPVPWDANYALPIAALLATNANAIYVANPNAPTGTLIPPAKIAELARAFPGLVLVDEAYADFADENCLHLLEDFANIVISRTLSKAYSLAGMRFGYAIAQPQVICEMMKVKDSYNCDAISVVAATAAISDQSYARWTWENIRNERRKLTAELTALGWSVQPSQANFLWAAPPDRRGREAYLGLKHQGILVRHFDKPGLSDHIRITVGQSHENNALLAGIRALTTAEKPARREPVPAAPRGEERALDQLAAP